jgi:hypothetical protein
LLLLINFTPFSSADLGPMPLWNRQFLQGCCKNLSQSPNLYLGHLYPLSSTLLLVSFKWKTHCLPFHSLKFFNDSGNRGIYEIGSNKETVCNSGHLGRRSSPATHLGQVTMEAHGSLHFFSNNTYTHKCEEQLF